MLARKHSIAERDKAFIEFCHLFSEQNNVKDALDLLKSKDQDDQGYILKKLVRQLLSQQRNDKINEILSVAEQVQKTLTLSAIIYYAVKQSLHEADARDYIQEGFNFAKNSDEKDSMKDYMLNAFIAQDAFPQLLAHIKSLQDKKERHHAFLTIVSGYAYYNKQQEYKNLFELTDNTEEKSDIGKLILDRFKKEQDGRGKIDFLHSLAESPLKLYLFRHQIFKFAFRGDVHDINQLLMPVDDKFFLDILVAMAHGFAKGNKNVEATNVYAWSKTSIKFTLLSTLINEFSKVGDFSNCMIFLAQARNIHECQILLSQIDKSVYLQEGFATLNNTIINLALVNDNIIRLTVVEDLLTKMPEYAHSSLLAKAVKLRELRVRNIVENDAEGLEWLSLRRQTLIMLLIYHLLEPRICDTKIFLMIASYASPCLASPRGPLLANKYIRNFFSKRIDLKAMDSPDAKPFKFFKLPDEQARKAANIQQVIEARSLLAAKI
jgi:hypothetical protein